MISSALPLLRTVVALVRGQKLDGLALVVLTVNAVSLAISFWSGNPRFMLAIILSVNVVVWLSTVLSVGCIGAGILIGELVADRIEKLVSAEATRGQQWQP